MIISICCRSTSSQKQVRSRNPQFPERIQLTQDLDAFIEEKKQERLLENEANKPTESTTIEQDQTREPSNKENIEPVIQSEADKPRISSQMKFFDLSQAKSKLKTHKAEDSIKKHLDTLSNILKELNYSLKP